MAEGITGELQQPQSGFVDSFTESPSNSLTELPETDTTVADQKQRFSDDFSNTESPIHNHREDNTPPTEPAAELNGWEIVPDRSDTPVDGKEDSESQSDDDDNDNLTTAITNTTTTTTTTTDKISAKEVTPPARQWESFDDDQLTNKRRRSSDSTRQKTKSAEDLDPGLYCGVDSETNQSEWTALGDTIKQSKQLEEEPLDDAELLPFRRTQSMRADTHRAVRIVDALKQQRRLSNTSLDRERTRKPFANEDDLTRKLKIDRQWDIYLKLSKRIPGTKTKWLPVSVFIKDGVLTIKKSAIPSPNRKLDVTPAVVEDIVLQHNHRMTGPVPRHYDRQNKLHQIKIQQAIIQEKRTIKRLFLMDHVTTCKTLYKLGSHDLGIIQNVSEAINEAVRQLPVTRARGVAYRVNEVFVDVKESSDILMNCDGAVLDRKSLVRIYVQAFLTGAPQCKLTLNDVEATLMQGKGLLSQTMSRQVRLENLVLHPCVNRDLYSASREINFQPVDGQTFELLRSSIDPYISPPINLSCLMDYNQTQHNVKITSSFIVRKKHNLRLRPITNLIIKFPIPSTWSSLFITESKFGQQRTIGSTASLRGSFRRKIKTHECQIETHLGSAKYEPEHQAIMWRIGTYSHTSQPHTFSCNIMLKPGMQKPDMYNVKAEVTYTIPGSSTGIVVKGFHVEAESTPETWVKYEIQYKYEVQMFPDLSID